MGNNNSNSHIAFESDGDEGITFVKGIRLSDKVIDRMRESPRKTCQCPGQKTASSSHTVPAAPQPSAPLPTAERLAPILPQPPQFASTLLPPPLIEPVPVIEPRSSFPLQHVSEEVKTKPPIPPVPTTPATTTPPAEDKVMLTPLVTEAVAPPSLLPEPAASSSPSPLSEPIPPPAQTVPTLVLAEPVALPASPFADPAFSTTPSPVATPIPPSVEHVAESLPTVDPEVIQKPSVEPTVVPVFVEHVPVHESPVEPVNISPPAPVVPVAEPPPAQPLDTEVPLVEPTDIPTLPVEVIAAPAHSEDSVVPVQQSTCTCTVEPVETPTSHLEPVAVSSPIETTDVAAEVISISVPPTDHSSLSVPPCETEDAPNISPEEVPTAPTCPPTEAVCTPSPVASPTPLPIAEEIEAIAMPSSYTEPTPVPLLALEDHADVLPNSTAAAPPVSEPLALPAAVDNMPSPPEKPIEIHSIPSLLDTMSPPPQLPPPKTPVVNEDEVRIQIKGELQRLLEQEMSQAQLRIQKQLEEEKLKARALAQAAAQVQIQTQVKKVLDEEKAALQKSLKEAIMKERMNTEDERLIAQYYAQKLEERDEDLKKQDALYREQINKLEEKSSQFYKVTNESFQKGKEDAHNRFKRFHIKPACSELQEQILKCYKDNQGQTLACSSIASLYIQCVEKAKQKTKTSIGG